jgi:hypothetical protein
MNVHATSFRKLGKIAVASEFIGLVEVRIVLALAVRVVPEFQRH